MGREELRSWAHLKMFEVVLSIALIFVFLAIALIISNINFQSIYSSAHLVPPQCDAGSLGNTDIFSLAVCNMHLFNNNVLTFSQIVYLVALRVSFTPQIKINGVAIARQLLNIKGVGGEASLKLPSGFETFSGDLLDALYTAFVLSQVQTLMLAAALLFFTLFTSLGLIARIFVVSRTFGGAMIAFGIGLGLLFPLLVSLTYGYINVQMQSAALVSALDLTTVTAAVGGLVAVVIAFIASGAGVPGFTAWFSSFIEYGAFAASGLILIPILNFTIVDVFISDFSQAIGERMDFMSLLTNII
ncbi:MAG: hypothetical protein M1286_01140 [Candidatus Marsarchaeota archaeon]|nr:hypothetical protein [Candidatus Marsarchaeota archaeon]